MYSPFYSPVKGGTELATYYLAKELQAFCDVEIFTFNWMPNLEKKYGLNMARNFPSKEIVNAVKINRYPINCLPIVKEFSPKLVMAIHSANTEILHFQGVHRLFSRWLLHKTTKNKIKILTTHTLQEAIEIVNRGRINTLLGNMLIDSIKKMDYYVALTLKDKVSLIQMGIPADSITIISNGVDAKKFDSRRNFVKKTQVPRILCVAGFQENKNQECLVSAFEKLSRLSKFEGHFIGPIKDFGYYKKVVKKIEKNRLNKIIQIDLSLDDIAVADSYLRSDIFVLPSIMETQPLVILEAMYAGLPVIATNVGGIPEIIKDGVNGFLVPPNDSEQLCQKCFKLLEDDKLRITMGNRNREEAKKYVWTEVAASTYDLYRKILSQ